MRRIITIIALSFMTLSLSAGVREKVWPKGKMPDAQEHQIAAMTDESEKPGFNPEKNRTAYLEWFDAPSAETRNGGCMILISGGSYECCCDVGLIKSWNEEFKTWFPVRQLRLQNSKTGWSSYIPDSMGRRPESSKDGKRAGRKERI